jgi:hypothetical protein
MTFRIPRWAVADRVRETPHLAYSFLRRSGLSVA